MFIDPRSRVSTISTKNNAKLRRRENRDERQREKENQPAKQPKAAAEREGRTGESAPREAGTENSGSAG